MGRFSSRARPVPMVEGYKVREARRMPGLSGAVLEAANESRRRQELRWAAEAVEEANAAPRTRRLMRPLGKKALYDERNDYDD